MNSLLLATSGNERENTKTTTSRQYFNGQHHPPMIQPRRRIGPGHLQSLLTVNSFRHPPTALSHHHPPLADKVHQPLPYPPPEPFFTTTPPRTRHKLLKGGTHTEPLPPLPLRPSPLIITHVVDHQVAEASFAHVDIRRVHVQAYAVHDVPPLSTPTCPFPRFSAWHHRSHTARVPER